SPVWATSEPQMGLLRTSNRFSRGERDQMERNSTASSHEVRGRRDQRRIYHGTPPSQDGEGVFSLSLILHMVFSPFAYSLLRGARPLSGHALACSDVELDFTASSVRSPISL
ncbi:hypothetical protein U1Q18_017541, partial [Sarracenia purpurea var. burkii]